MAKIRTTNTLHIKILSIVGVLLGVLLLLFLSYKVIIKDVNTKVYDLGEMSKFNDYHDYILTTYDAYQGLMEQYNLNKELTASDFTNNYYLVSFQEYDGCSESKYKSVKSIDILDDKIIVNFKIHNKCGWCQKHLTLYLIKINKTNSSKGIEYTYDYARKQNCGSI